MSIPAALQFSFEYPVLVDPDFYGRIEEGNHPLRHLQCSINDPPLPTAFIGHSFFMEPKGYSDSKAIHGEGRVLLNGEVAASWG